eukprot:TRINITY_DN64965_c0_g1_i1.p1 TRINITY_DN64965_c0_g1~~TRINITY_DN64965_c0_g1_i1.p1  ORF type:complete len:290 (-),score=69.69 TRINITY_DN64965_c0_g1_i1:48-917(-)
MELRPLPPFVRLVNMAWLAFDPVPEALLANAGGPTHFIEFDPEDEECGLSLSKSEGLCPRLGEWLPGMVGSGADSEDPIRLDQRIDEAVCASIRLRQRRLVLFTSAQRFKWQQRWFGAAGRAVPEDVDLSEVTDQHACAELRRLKQWLSLKGVAVYLEMNSSCQIQIVAKLKPPPADMSDRRIFTLSAITKMLSKDSALKDGGVAAELESLWPGGAQWGEHARVYKLLVRASTSDQDASKSWLDWVLSVIQRKVSIGTYSVSLWIVVVMGLACLFYTSDDAAEEDIVYP